MHFSRRFVVNMITTMILLLMCAACSSTVLQPEADLLGQWTYPPNAGDNFFYADDLQFMEDGRLIFDGQITNAAKYVVIAPGRIKVTRGGEAEVYTYTVEGDRLIFYLEDQICEFQFVGAAAAVSQNGTDPAESVPVYEFEPSPSSTQRPTMPLPTQTFVRPTLTPAYTATLVSPSATATSSLEDKYVDYQVNQKDGMAMVYVPEGEFLMGSNPDEDPYFWGAEGPAHPIFVDSFWIYQTEVTNAMYQACVAEKACPKPLRNESRTVVDYYTNERFANYPVIQVNYIDATAYCVWAGGRLPTEAEWEKAGRGTDGRLWPWGNMELKPEYASFCGSNCPETIKENLEDKYIEIAPVGSFPEGASPYGVLDMAGNVWEWVFDYFAQLYYDSSPYENPRGPLSGDRRVIRGGGWNNSLTNLRVVQRASLPPRDGLDTVGFRCVIDND